MKKILLVLISVLIYTTISEAYMKQGNWRWRNDDGSETTATWKAAENTGLGTISHSTSNIRLRIGLYNDDPSYMRSLNMVLYYSSDGSTWTQITTNLNNAFFLSSSSLQTSTMVKILQHSYLQVELILSRSNDRIFEYVHQGFSC